MLFTTGLLGAVEVDESSIIEFPLGLPGFEQCTRFKLFHDAVQSSPLVYWLQSLDDADLLFSVVNHVTLGLHYEIELSDDEVATLQLQNLQDAMVLVMVYKEEEQADGEVRPLLSSLKGNVSNPLVLNLASRRGLQKGGQGCNLVQQ